MASVIRAEALELKGALPEENLKCIGWSIGIFQKCTGKVIFWIILGYVLMKISIKLRAIIEEKRHNFCSGNKEI